jgi:hypothetical protein
MAEGLTTKRRITCFVRPPRHAVGVLPMGGNNWLTVLRRSTLTWGALDSTLCFPLAGWRPGNLWDRLLQVFDPDVITVMQEGPFEDQLLKRLAPLQVLHDPFAVHREKQSWMGGTFCRLDRLVRALPYRTIISHSGITASSAPLPLQMILARNCGLLAREELDALWPSGGVVSMTDLSLDPADTGFIEHMSIVLDGSQRSLRALNQFDLNETRALLPFLVNDQVLVVGETSDDVCLWLALRAIRLDRSVSWLPDSLMEEVPGSVADLYRRALVLRFQDFRYREAVNPQAPLLLAGLTGDYSDERAEFGPRCSSRLRRTSSV